MNNKPIFQSSGKPMYSKVDEDRKNYISSSARNEPNVDFNHNSNYNNQTNIEDLYKQYKHNMFNTINSKSANKDNLQTGRKSENEINVIEMVLPVKTKSEGQDDWIRELKVSMTVSYISPSKQQISINLTDPNDPLFLFSVEIGEQEFHYLKQELSLLIEFQHFPQKFFEMLDLCSQGVLNLNQTSFRENLSDTNILNKSLVQSNYVCVLHNNSNLNESLLIIQEITQLRQLNHLILRFKAAGDNSLKKYLSVLVKEFKFKSESLMKENQKLNENLDTSYRELKNFKEELSNIKNIHMNELENFKVEHHREINDTRERLFEESKMKLEQKEGEKNDIVAELESKIEDLSKKLENLKSEKICLEEAKIRLEAKERDLEGRNCILSSELNVYKSEVDNLRNNSSNLNTTNFTQERHLTELRVKNELLIQQLEDKDRNIHNLSQLVDNLNKQRQDSDEQMKSIKSSSNKMEDKLQASIAEINRGNEIIQKLQSDLKSQKDRLKLKNQAYKTLEQLLNKNQTTIDESVKHGNDLKRELERKEDEIRNLKSTIESYSIKLEEAQKILEDNEKVIRFLNSNLNSSYQPMRDMMKSENVKNNNNDLSQYTSKMKSPLSTFNHQSNQENYTKDSMIKNQFYQTGNVNNLNAMIMPETNFAGYKKDKYLNSTGSISNNIEYDSLSKFNKHDLGSNVNSVTNISSNMNSNLLGHKYGNPIKTQSYIENINQNIEEEQPRPVPLNRDFYNKNMK